MICGCITCYNIIYKIDLGATYTGSMTGRRIYIQSSTIPSIISDNCIVFQIYRSCCSCSRDDFNIQSATEVTGV